MKKISFDPAWTMLLSVIGTLVAMNFMDDERARNLLAGAVLTGCFFYLFSLCSYVALAAK